MPPAGGREDLTFYRVEESAQPSADGCWLSGSGDPLGAHSPRVRAVVLIFGFGPGRAQDKGEVAPVRCPACNNDVMLHHVVSKKTFRLFFVPVLPYGTDEYLLCPICTQGAPLTPAQRPDIEALKTTTAAWRAGEVPWERYEATVEDAWRRLGFTWATPAGAEPASRAAVSPPRPGRDVESLADRLEALVRMHEHGELTDGQFEEAKRKLVGEGPPPTQGL